MHRGTWKLFERDCAKFIDGKRYHANAGGRVDVHGPIAIGQCKYRSNLSHQNLSDLAEEMEELGRQQGRLGCVLHGVPPGPGKQKPKMITMTFEAFNDWFAFKKPDDGQK